jgi:Divergent InlB B-repeat domain/Bacterial Ig-like domain (group 2)
MTSLTNIGLFSRTAALLFLLAGLVQCTNAPALTSIQVLPNAATATFVGQTVQYKAFGTFNRAGTHPSTSQDITNQVAWTSSSAAVSVINASGLATTTGLGSTTITASLNGVTASVLLVESSNQPANSLTALTLIPASQTIDNLGEPAQFVAIGTYNTNPITQDLTAQVNWQSSDSEVATVNSSGLALGNDCGTTTITATGKSSTGAAITASATLTFAPLPAPPAPPGDCANTGPVPLPTLTIYEVGSGSGIVTSSPVGINCGSGTGCTGNFVAHSTVTLTATPAGGSSFGGWSSNCTPDSGSTCTIVMNNNEPVGAIFNSQ